jgi:hypothetical protein
MKFNNTVKTENRNNIHGEICDASGVLTIQTESIASSVGRTVAVLGATMLTLYGSVIAIEKVERWRNKAKCSKTEEKKA